MERSSLHHPLRVSLLVSVQTPDNDDLIGRNANGFLLLPFRIRKRFFCAPLMNAIKHLKYLPLRIGVY